MNDESRSQDFDTHKSVIPVPFNTIKWLIFFCLPFNSMTGIKINPDYVLAPFHNLLKDCHNNVLIGLRLVERLEKFPEPTKEELQFIQLSMGEHATDLSEGKFLFKKWILVNGFEDIHKCFRITLERLFILKSIEGKVKTNETFDLQEVESELKVKASNFYFDQLVNTVNTLFPEPLRYQKHILSFNNARNCLVHTNGIVTARHCNNSSKDKLSIAGNRFRLFFKKGDLEVLAELGKPGPENAALMLGGEEFQIEFDLGSEIHLDLKQFLDILNTCVFVRADIDDKLK